MRAWEQLTPREARLSIAVDLQRKSLDIRDLRLTGCAYSRTEWIDDHAPALLITECRLIPSREVTKLTTTTLAMITLHGLARWMQRSDDNTEWKLWHGLISHLLQGHPDA